MRLLLAEDEKEMAHALEAVFTHNHYSVDVVYNGIDAADWAESGNYDGMILDIMMPGKSGLEVLSEWTESIHHQIGFRHRLLLLGTVLRSRAILLEKRVCVDGNVEDDGLGFPPLADHIYNSQYGKRTDCKWIAAGYR